ncbi:MULTISPECIES: TetR/AcrR family transcriptional regulator [unclassified Sphingomonas]|uniref:TetR/AcrR family transcriptional regulator n=1 Tax=unclassified Sphingomonas TaxID=196159 RepID=UPI0025E5ACE2|nr:MULTISPECIES: TetR/AcrR family transcriptional regulator [unclassified Sphingomonas]
MKITKAQSQENRVRIVDAASAMFREQGYDGVSVADLMGAAGLTHGGFYKHFGSKADLMAEAAASGVAQILDQAGSGDIRQFIDFYTSREHRDGRGAGCTMAALSGDAARQSGHLKATFADGIERILDAVERGGMFGDGGQDAVRAQAIDMFAHLLGAVVLSRACPDDSPLADEILHVCRAKLLESLPSTDTD